MHIELEGRNFGRVEDIDWPWPLASYPRGI